MELLMQWDELEFDTHILIVPEENPPLPNDIQQSKHLWLV